MIIFSVNNLDYIILDDIFVFILYNEIQIQRYSETQKSRKSTYL